MAQSSNIEWTEHTWNPVTGCSKISAGCKNCYAETIANRFWKNRKFTDVRWHDDRLQQPMKRRKPTTYFVNSMSDLFHEDVPFDFIDKVFAVMALCPQHTFQVLTKRAERMAEYLNHEDAPMRILRRSVEVQTPETRFSNQCGTDGWWPLPNAWLGVSVENQEQADERIPHLLKCPAAVRFLSCEPMLGPVDFAQTSLVRDGEATGWNLFGSPDCGIDWAIVGGESGPGARPCRIEWVRSVVNQCKNAGVPVFVKQLGSNIVCRNDCFGGWNPTDWPQELDVERVEHDIYGFREEYQGADCRVHLIDKKGGDMEEWPEDLRIREMPQ